LTTLYLFKKGTTNNRRARGQTAQRRRTSWQRSSQNGAKQTLVGSSQVGHWTLG
jgi:hypothetical protein